MATPSGGKIVANRRKQRLSSTPYDRPRSPPPLKRSNWFSGVIVPSARAIASGTGKIISSIFTESETSTSEDEDADAEQDIDSEIPDGINAINEKNRVSLDLMPYENSVRRTETKHIIEKLISQETFTREECDWMVKLLHSRIVDSSMRSAEGNELFGSPSPDRNHEVVDVYDKVTLEAKMWFKDKNVGSISATHKGSGTSKVENSGTSPVDVARSYMKERPCWASPIRNFGDITPFSSKLFHEGASLSLSKKRRSSLASGSWNIQEELHRLRAKATEEMLQTPSKKLDPNSSRISINGAEDTEFMGRQQRANRVSSPQPNSSAGTDSKQSHGQHVEENHITNTQPNTSETYTEVPIVAETESIANGSQNDLEVQNEEFVDGKQHRKKPTGNRPSRRGSRARGL